jgi:hypothetical protein
MGSVDQSSNHDVSTPESLSVPVEVLPHGGGEWRTQFVADGVA